MKPLTTQRQLFVYCYCQHWNGAQAAREAGYSESIAKEHASLMLKDEAVKHAIDKQLNKIMGKIDIDTETVVQEIGKLAFANVKDLYDEYGDLIPVHQLPREVAACIIEVTETNFKGKITRKYKTEGKSKNLELLGRYLQMFVEKVEIKTASDMYNDINQHIESSPKNAIRH